MAQESTATAPQPERSCARCKYPLPFDAKFCSNCAYPLNDAWMPPSARPRFLGRHPAVKEWTSLLNKAAQILAIVVAGLWTYKTFSEADQPSLEPHLAASADVDWFPVLSPRACEGNVKISLENIGKKSVEVTEVRLRGWIADIPSGANLSTPRLYSDEDLEKAGQIFFDKTFNSGYLLGHFPPGAKSEDTFNFLFRKQPTKEALWVVEFKTTERLKYPAMATANDYVCNNP
jgi:hypothetical protein